MNPWPDAGEAFLPAAMLLDQAEMAVIVTDRRTNLLYVNAYALRLLNVPGDAAALIGRSVLSDRLATCSSCSCSCASLRNWGSISRMRSRLNASLPRTRSRSTLQRWVRWTAA